MKFELKSFRTRVARRVFFLFVICALMPVSTLAVVAFIHVRGQLVTQSESRLREETKAVAVSVYERLLFLRAELQSTVSLIKAVGPSQAMEFSRNRQLTAPSNFKRLAVIDDGGSHALVGDAAGYPELTPEEKTHVASGRALLLIPSVDHVPGGLFMAVSGVSGGKVPDLLIGEIDSAYLWEAAERRPPGTEAVILGTGRALLYSSIPADTKISPARFRFPAEAHSGQFDLTISGEKFLASFTAIFLGPNFFYPRWTVMVSEPETQIFAPMETFKIVFPVLFVLTLALVFILSVNLIHKNLVPIEDLKAATEEIAGGGYGYQVDIRSHDEFETLGDSFNEMSRRIGESQTLLARTSKMATMGQVAAGIMHEIKQPLSAIHGQLQLILLADLPEEEKERLTMCFTAVERLDRILGRFRTFTHMSAEAISAVELGPVIDNISGLMAHQLKMKNITLETRCSDNLPKILGDKQALQQVVSNLLINAMDAFGEGGGKASAEIRIRISGADGKVVLEIEDNGCGMPRDVQEHIFDPFFTTKGADKGTGLGLAIVESILHKMKAGITVESEAGVGTKFTLRFREAPKSGTQEEAA
jgi:signal transduction histidine kinase